MPETDLQIAQRTAGLHTGVARPEFGALTILSRDPWQYVQLWLRRQRSDKAVFYWDQARQFYEASRVLSPSASPVTSYYCVLNATKAFLTHSKRTFAPEHGVSRGPDPKGKVSLKKEIFTMKTSGVLAALCHEVGDPLTADEEWSLFDVLREMPFVHRAFCLTFRSVREQFIPLKEQKFVRHATTREVWFVAQVNANYRKNLAQRLPPEFEVDAGHESGLKIRMRPRVDIARRGFGPRELSKLSNYHARVRRHVVPIVDPVNRWYLRESAAARRSQIPLIYAALHRLSELSRYEALRLRAHFDAQPNWVLTEFLRVAPAQFVHLLASEITGKQFLEPKAVRLQ